ncbi:MAG: hypothetical protein BM557_01860 [Flavobacterium sp. MedPE-SWcel]|uniref:hypothetical protein n=1 Tax=uncultured Flavobacterium sp. TaxID=165435 RepID=UPI000910ED97|nr:hypothetical protein [uncultured Flavobacterium sp.]OIQ22145.1 MAG: hypothetical protein BM557_01860 [Flavobacterium sp. MedPE-SWcel]
MKRIALLSLLLSVPFFIGCKEEVKPKPKVTYEEEDTKVTIKKEAPRVDTTQIKIADLPVHMEGTEYLIHPIGDIRIYGKGSKIYGSSRTNNISYAISNYNRFEITGYFKNLKFQHIDSTALYSLVDKQMQIQKATYLNTVARRQVLVYELVDYDTNHDDKIDDNDIKSLYISDISGRNFQKLSQDMQELIDWNVVEVQNKLYYRTIEDINKNGAFDENDKVHYYYVDLLSAEWEITDYKPVAIIKTESDEVKEIDSTSSK